MFFKVFQTLCLNLYLECYLVEFVIKFVLLFREHACYYDTLISINLSRMECPTVINWTSQFPFYGLLVSIFSFLFKF